MKIYKIWCEWDMGQNWEERAFSSREKASKEIENADWEGLVDMTLMEVLSDQLVGVEELELD